MLIDQFEKDLKQLGLEAEHHRVLLCLPPLFVLSRDGPISVDEQQQLERFARERLLFGSAEMNHLRDWLRVPPRVSETTHGLTVLHALHVAPDVAAVDNKTLQQVLLESERLLRQRSREGEATHRGNEALQRLSEQFAIDLGAAWEEVDPELLEQPSDAESREPSEDASSHSAGEGSRRDPARRWRTALALQHSHPHEPGGLV